MITARGLAKGFGKRLPATVTARFGERAQRKAPEILVAALGGLLEQIDALSRQIRSYDERMLALAEAREEVERLASMPGVGTLTALTFVDARAPRALRPLTAAFSSSRKTLRRSRRSGVSAR